MRVEIKSDSRYPIVDVNTPEAAAEFKRQRALGTFGPSEAQRLETERILAFYDREYEEKMSYVEFCDKVVAGEIVVPGVEVK